MKRFYCTICGKMKRVRKLPALIDNADAKNPINRKGACNRHAPVGYHTRPGSISRKVS